MRQNWKKMWKVKMPIDKNYQHEVWRTIAKFNCSVQEYSILLSSSIKEKTVKIKKIEDS